MFKQGGNIVIPEIITTRLHRFSFLNNVRLTAEFTESAEDIGWRYVLLSPSQPEPVLLPIEHNY